MECLGLGGQSPASLTIAEHTEALGNGSSRPAAPSGATPQAEGSVIKHASEDNAGFSRKSIDEIVRVQTMRPFNDVNEKGAGGSQTGFLGC